MCWVMPPNSPATTSVSRIASSSLVLPWSTWPMTVTTGGRGASEGGLVTSSSVLLEPCISSSMPTISACRPSSSATIAIASSDSEVVAVAISPASEQHLHDVGRALPTFSAIVCGVAPRTTSRTGRGGSGTTGLRGPRGWRPFGAAAAASAAGAGATAGAAGGCGGGRGGRGSGGGRRSLRDRGGSDVRGLRLGLGGRGLLRLGLAWSRRRFEDFAAFRRLRGLAAGGAQTRNEVLGHAGRSGLAAHPHLLERPQQLLAGDP